MWNRQVNDHVVTALHCCTLCLWTAHSWKKKYTGTDTHIVADISAPKEVQETGGTDTEWVTAQRGDQAWLVQYKHPIQNALHIYALHTFTRTHTEVMMLACCLHLTQLYCPWVPSLAERVVCGGFVWTAGLKTPGSRAQSSNISWLALKSPVLGKHHP